MKSRKQPWNWPEFWKVHYTDGSKRIKILTYSLPENVELVIVVKWGNLLVSNTLITLCMAMQTQCHGCTVRDIIAMLLQVTTIKNWKEQVVSWRWVWLHTLTTCAWLGFEFVPIVFTSQILLLGQFDKVWVLDLYCVSRLLLVVNCPTRGDHATNLCCLWCSS